MKAISSFIALMALLLAVCPHNVVRCKEFDMKPFWDDKTPLENPHKGWYHHYPDNHINKYIIKKDSHLLDFPGMDHLYIRLAWAYLEPEEGKFNWDMIDDIIKKWTDQGLKIAFRISCKETSTDRIEQQFATPKWVMEAGAKGGYYRNGKQVGPDGPWEPVFDDPVFLQKLEHFIQAFADRYDGKPWIRYIDIGSIGDWGEGHTHSGSRKDYGYTPRRKHIDIHLKHFKQTQLVITDDYVYSIDNLEDREKLHRYIIEQGISYRDDSPLVNWYVKTYPETYSVRSPGFFKDAYLNTPTVFELQHYHAVKRDGNWKAKEGSYISQYAKGKTGPDFFHGALELLHATYIGYHGDAHEWLTENPKRTVELLNRCGYWYFLHHVKIPDTIKTGGNCQIQMEWQNRGVAPAYHPYHLYIRLEGPKTLDIELNANNQRWLPSNKTCMENYTLSIPNSLPPGQYTFKMKLFSQQDNRDVFLALDPNRMDKQNYYKIGEITIVHP